MHRKQSGVVGLPQMLSPTLPPEWNESDSDIPALATPSKRVTSKKKSGLPAQSLIVKLHYGNNHAGGATELTRSKSTEKVSGHIGNGKSPSIKSSANPKGSNASVKPTDAGLSASKSRRSVLSSAGDQSPKSRSAAASKESSPVPGGEPILNSKSSLEPSAKRVRAKEEALEDTSKSTRLNVTPEPVPNKRPAPNGQFSGKGSANTSAANTPSSKRPGTLENDEEREDLQHSQTPQHGQTPQTDNSVFNDDPVRGSSSKPGKQAAEKSPGSSRTSKARQKDGAKYKQLRQQLRSWMDLARRKKHEADKASSSSQMKKAAILSIDCIICFMRGFDVEERAEKLAGRAPHIRSWETLVPYLDKTALLLQKVDKDLAGSCLFVSAVTHSYFARHLSKADKPEEAGTAALRSLAEFKKGFLLLPRSKISSYSSGLHTSLSSSEGFDLEKDGFELPLHVDSSLRQAAAFIFRVAREWVPKDMEYKFECLGDQPKD